MPRSVQSRRYIQAGPVPAALLRGWFRFYDAPYPPSFPSSNRPPILSRLAPLSSSSWHDLVTLAEPCTRYPILPELPYPVQAFLKYPLVTTCPEMMLNTVSPAPKYPSANDLIEESGMRLVAGLPSLSVSL